MSNPILPCDLQGFLDLETEFGYPIRDITVLNGSYLVWKIPMAEESKGMHGRPIILAQQYRRRAVGNLVSIFGYVIKASQPWRQLRATKYWVNLPESEAVKDGLPGTMRPKYKVRHGCFVEAQIPPGRAILYNSYNVGQIHIPELEDHLTLVREIDIVAHFPVEKVESLELGDFALSREHVF